MSNGSGPGAGRARRPGRLGLPARPRGQRDRAGPTRPSGTGCGQSIPRTLLEASGLAVGTPRRPDGQQRGGPSEPRRGPGGSAGPGAHLPEHPHRRVLPARAAGGALCAGSGRPAAPCTCVGLLGPGGVHAIDQHLLACVELGVRLEVPRIAIHGFLDGRDTAPTIGDEVVRTLLQRHARASPGRAVDIATLIRPLLRRWTGTAGGSAPGSPTMRWSVASAPPLKTPSRPCRRRTSGARPTSSSSRSCLTADGAAGRADPRRRRDLLLQLSQRPDAPDRAGAVRRRLRRIRRRPTGPAVRCVTMTQYDQTFPGAAGLPAVHHGADRGRGAGRRTGGPSSGPRRPRSIPT